MLIRIGLDVKVSCLRTRHAHHTKLLSDQELTGVPIPFSVGLCCATSLTRSVGARAYFGTWLLRSSAVLASSCDSDQVALYPAQVI